MVAPMGIMCFSCRQTVQVQRPAEDGDFTFPCPFCQATNRVKDAPHQFLVAVPPGCAAGSTLRFLTPERLKMEATVPNGVPRGGRFAVAYQPRKFAVDSALANLSIHTVTQEDLDKAPADCKECAVCLEAYRVGDVQVYLPCFHRFHDTCARGSCSQSTRCPLCNRDVHEAYREAEELLGEQLAVAIRVDAGSPTPAEAKGSCTCVLS